MDVLVVGKAKGYGTGRVHISTQQEHTWGQISDFVVLEQNDSWGLEIFSVDLTVCMLQTR